MNPSMNSPEKSEQFPNIALNTITHGTKQYVGAGPVLEVLSQNDSDAYVYLDEVYDEETRYYTDVEVKVPRAFFLHGDFIGGYDTHGRFIENQFSNRTMDDFTEQVSSQERIKNQGIKLIFNPELPEFDPETMTSGPERQIAALITPRLMEAQIKQYQEYKKLDQTFGYDDEGDTEESTDYLSTTVITSDSFLGELKNTTKRVAALARPSYEVEIEDKPYRIGTPFLLAGDRMAAIVWSITNADELDMPSIFYQSNSHGSWRSLLATTKKGWFAKGMYGDEHSADVPLALQKALSTISLDVSHDPNKTPVSYDAIKAFIPTLEDQESAIAYGEFVMRSNQVQQSYRNRFIGWRDNNDDMFRKGFAPDFSVAKDSWDVNTQKYGRVKAEVYDSRNGEVAYMIYSALDDRNVVQRWVASAEEKDEAISRISIRTGWPYLNNLVTKPPIDYYSRIRKEDKDKRGYEDRRTHATRFDQFAKRSLAAHAARRKKQTNASDE